jgi:hypothetical protein
MAEKVSPKHFLEKSVVKNAFLEKKFKSIFFDITFFLKK